jgi:hypothetical protein
LCSTKFCAIHFHKPTAQFDWEGGGAKRHPDRHILAPISAPGFVVVLIWQFNSIWNEFLFAVVLANKPAVQPITVALNNLAGSYIVEWNVQMAGALLAALPTLLIFIFLGRFFMRGLLAGALKRQTGRGGVSPPFAPRKNKGRMTPPLLLLYRNSDSSSN